MHIGTQVGAYHLSRTIASLFEKSMSLSMWHGLKRGPIRCVSDGLMIARRIRGVLMPKVRRRLSLS